MSRDPIQASQKQVIRSAWRERLRAQKLCLTCRQPQDSTAQQCSKCRAKVKAYAQKRHAQLRDQGVCRQCAHAPIAGAQTLCLRCWYMSIAQKHSIDLEVLKALPFSTCPYFGVVLKPGINLSIDHKLPRSREGTSQPDNLEWVSELANRMKCDLTPEEFIEMCTLIAKNHA